MYTLIFLYVTPSVKRNIFFRDSKDDRKRLQMNDVDK